jgi:hypothetical protein
MCDLFWHGYSFDSAAPPMRFLGPAAANDREAELGLIGPVSVSARRSNPTLGADYVHLALRREEATNIAAQAATLLSLSLR